MAKLKVMSKQPRAYTSEECRTEFLEVLAQQVRYWNRVDDDDHRTQLRRMSGLVFSILCILDGVDGALPAYVIAPLPHPDDLQDCIAQGSNYYPDNAAAETRLKAKLHGDDDESVLLHELWYEVMGDTEDTR